MTIIAIKHQLMQFFSDVSLNKIAFQCGFIQRVRNIEPRVLILSLIAALSTGKVTSIAQLHQKFNGLCPDKKQQVSYRPFYNQLRKTAFVEFVKILVRFAMAQWADKSVAIPKKLTKFQNVILQDGSSFKVHSALSDVFPYRFRSTDAAVECHMTLSLFTQSPVKMTVTADTASERAYLPAPETLYGQLLLADAGYVDFDYFERVSYSGGSFIVRGSKSLNPQIITARNGQGKLLPKLADKPLKSITRRTNRSEVLDLICRRNGYEFRLVRRWFAEEKRFCLWLTNLSVEAFTASDIMDIYRCRWQIELLFKELKSHTNWHGFTTRKETIATGLIWLSLLALLLRRSLASQLFSTVSLFKAAQNTDIWLRPIIETLLQTAWSETYFWLEKAQEYLCRNAFKTSQKKSCKNKTLDACFERLNS
ncbi:IS4 family transposase (plasmid) [Xenorhabdus sp. SF857]|uniref:IS4 family transposase n=1 Tax=Xenorhabdus bakwenae TaxID=3026967 RepID=UPI00255816C5|nr:IS4 family transposase [Xenorhabdus sp. SF857]WFQ78154.1 IS4 family transposase [Xenorhabdus sp. SF857]WFQ78158.1 IS4 family transposase [Xenorhabdus sp. SF857]